MLRDFRSAPINDGYFCRDTLAATIDARPEVETAREINFIQRVARLSPGSRVLDVGCGAGRQSIALARAGYSVVGVEKSELFFQEARKRAVSAEVDIEFINADVRDLVLDTDFDAAVSFYSAFGYHSDEDNRKVLAVVTRALRLDGRFILDITNRDAVANVEREVKVTRVNDLEVIKENTFDPFTSRRRLDWTYIRENRVINRTSFDHRMYSLHELLELFRSVGLIATAVFSDVEEKPFRVGCRRIMLVGARDA